MRAKSSKQHCPALCIKTLMLTAKKARMNIVHSHVILFNLKICSDIVIT